MRYKNSHDHFGLVSILIHWIMAVLIVGLLGLGLYMTRIPVSAEKLKLYGLHKEFGMLVLMLFIVRIIWHLRNIEPSLDALSPLERFAARAVHWAFYFFMLAMPITGWLITSSAGLPVSFFGLFLIPNLTTPSEELRPVFTELHRWIAYALIVVFSMHVAAALKHHFINKDNILKRMLKP